MNKFNQIAAIKYRDPLGNWWPIGKVGACVEDAQATQASVYLHCMYLGRCYAFPYEGCPFPYIHGDLLAHNGHYEEGGVKQSRWVRCGFISTHEVDGSDWNGEERCGKQMYRLQLDALPTHSNKKGTAMVLKVKL